MSLINLLHVIHNLDVAGVQTVVKNLAIHRDPSLVHPVVCAWKRGGPLLAELKSAGIEVHAPGTVPVTRNPLKILRYLKSLVESRGIELIHGHMSDGAFWGGLLSLRTRVPFVLSHYSNRLISYRIDRKSARGRIRFLLLKRGARRAALNIACADSVRERLREELRLPENAVEVIPNGVPVPNRSSVDAAVADRALAAARGHPGETSFSVVTIGRHDDIKGQDALVKAAPLLLRRCPGARIVLVGEGPRTGEWRELASRLGVEDGVVFTGHVEETVPFLQKAHVYVSTSHFEGISLALLEAMAWCLPVVATDVPGNRDTIVDGETGLLVPLGDPERLVEAIAGLREDPARAIRLAESGRRAVIESFSIERMVQRYQSIYRRLAGRGASPGA